MTTVDVFKYNWKTGIVLNSAQLRWRQEGTRRSSRI